MGLVNRWSGCPTGRVVGQFEFGFGTEVGIGSGSANSFGSTVATGNSLKTCSLSNFRTRSRTIFGSSAGGWPLYPSDRNSIICAVVCSPSASLKTSVGHGSIVMMPGCRFESTMTTPPSPKSRNEAARPGYIRSRLSSLIRALLFFPLHPPHRIAPERVKQIEPAG
jgi:hypothetical protein